MFQSDIYSLGALKNQIHAYLKPGLAQQSFQEYKDMYNLHKSMLAGGAPKEGQLVESPLHSLAWVGLVLYLQL